MAHRMTFILLLKNYIEVMNKQKETREEIEIKRFDVSKGRCIVPNLELVVQDSKFYLNRLSKFDLLKILKMSNHLSSLILEETNHRILS